MSDPPYREGAYQRYRTWLNANRIACGRRLPNGELTAGSASNATECGSDGGYYRHRADGTDACDACEAAHSTATAKREHEARAVEPHPVQGCAVTQRVPQPGEVWEWRLPPARRSCINHVHSPEVG